jgi:hypothetical protein
MDDKGEKDKKGSVRGEEKGNTGKGMGTGGGDVGKHDGLGVD